MGVCNKCLDTTQYLNVTNSTTQGSQNFTLPNGLWVSPSPTGYNPYLQVGPEVNFASDLFGNTSAEWNATVASMTVLSWIGEVSTTTGSPISVSCLMYACLKNYYGFVDAGELNENVVSEVAAPTASGGSLDSHIDGNYTAIEEPCWLDGQSYDRSNFSTVSSGNYSFEIVNLAGTNVSVPFECLYKMSPYLAEAMQAYAEFTLFTGQCQYSAGRANSFDCGDQYWLTPLYNDGNATLASTSRIM